MRRGCIDLPTPTLTLKLATLPCVAVVQQLCINVGISPNMETSPNQKRLKKNAVLRLVNCVVQAFIANLPCKPFWQVSCPIQMYIMLNNLFAGRCQLLG